MRVSRDVRNCGSREERKQENREKGKWGIGEFSSVMVF